VIRKVKAATAIMTNLAMPRHPIQTELSNLRLSSTTARAPSGSKGLTKITQIHATLADHGRTGILESLASRTTRDGFHLRKETQIPDTRIGEY
jgi:hypothetical protein